MTNGLDYAACPASTGRPTPPTSEISIRDNAFAALPPGAVGEICLRNPANMRGYVRPCSSPAWSTAGSGAATRASTTTAFYSSSTGLGDIIVRGGENIAAQEVENRLYRHPGVAEAAVLGQFDIRLGEIVAAVIHPAAPRGRRRQPAHAEFIGRILKFRRDLPAAPLPRTASEKIDKRVVRALFRTPRKCG